MERVMSAINEFFTGSPTIYDLANFMVILVLLIACLSMNSKLHRIASTIHRMHPEETPPEMDVDG